MRNSVFYFFYATVFLSSCSLFDDEPQIITENCEAFDSRIAETEWIAFSEGIEPQFITQNDTINLIPNFFSSEPYVIEYENKLFTLFPDGQVRDCFAQFASEYVSEDEKIRIGNFISYQNNKENVRFRLSFNNLSIDLAVEGDSLKIDEQSIGSDEIEFFQLENYDTIDFNGTIYSNSAKIEYIGPSNDFQEAIIVRNFGLLLFQKNDTIWIRN